MEIRIPYKTKKDYYNNWLLFLNPILHLREQTEIPVLAAFLLLYDTHKDYDENTLYSLLFSDETKLAVRLKLKVSERSFNKSFRALEVKGLIVDGKLNKKILPNKKLNISFSKLINIMTVSYGSLEDAMEIMDAKEETWENLKEFYPNFELEYNLTVGEDGQVRVRVLIYDKEQ